MSDLLDDVITKLAANHFDYHREGTNVPAIVIPVPVRPVKEMTGRGGPKHTSGNYVVVDNDGLKLLFYPGTTWTAGDYDDEASASAATIKETRQVIAALYDFGRPMNEIMEFDHVIEVKANGLIVDRLDLHAPNLRNGELETSAVEQGWSLMAGYTGQQGGGDIMHNSEFIGGGMEQDIRETPGIYVALVCDWDPEDDDGDDDDTAEGWAVATMEVSE